MKYFSNNEQKKKRRPAIHFFVALDLIAFILSFFAANELRNMFLLKASHLWQYSYFLTVTFFVTAVNFYLFDLYYRKIEFRRFQKSINLILALTVSMAIISVISYADKTLLVKRTFLLVFFGTLFIFTSVIRLFYDRLKRTKLRKQAIIVGASETGQLIGKRCAGGGLSEVNIIGYVSKYEHEEGLFYSGLERLGGIRDIRRIVAEKNIDFIIYAPKDINDYELNEILIQEKLAGCNLFSAIDFYSETTGQIPYEQITSSWLIEDCLRANKFGQVRSKRMLDIALGSVFFITTLPLFFLCAILVVIDSSGPMLFVQERIGIFGRPFKILKLRTMRMESKQQGQEAENWHEKQETRITRIGHFLRKYHLDEIPQFINVIKGEMSIVGPRPEMEIFIRQCEKKYLFTGSD